MSRDSSSIKAKPRRPAGKAGSASARAVMPRRRKRSTASAPRYLRRPWLRTLALMLGILVLLAHIFTLKPIAVWIDWLHIDWPDIAKHFTMLSLFALTYRLSWGSVSRHEKSNHIVERPGFATVIVCSGWGAVCECVQHWIPARDFNVFELAVNVLTPLFIAGLVALVQAAITAWRESRG